MKTTITKNISVPKGWEKLLDYCQFKFPKTAGRDFETLYKKITNFLVNSRARSKKNAVPCTLTKNDLIAVIESELWKPCPCCGEYLTMKNMSFDHIIPLDRQGHSERDNTMLLCTRCNRRKGSLLLWEYKSLLSFLDEMHPEAKAYVLSKLSQAPSYRF